MIGKDLNWQSLFAGGYSGRGTNVHPCDPVPKGKYAGRLTRGPESVFSQGCERLGDNRGLSILVAILLKEPYSSEKSCPVCAESPMFEDALNSVRGAYQSISI